MPAYYWFYDYVTCGLTAKKSESAPCPMLVIENGTTLLFYSALCYWCGEK